MNKRKVLKNILVLIFLLFVLSGCTTDYDIKDVRAEVTEKFGLENFEVSSVTYIMTEDDGYEDEVWTVTIPETGLIFHVINDYYWGLESMANSLNNDYTGAVIYHIYEKLPTFQYLEIEKEISDDGIFSAQVVGNFENEEELQECYEELLLLKESLTDLGYEDLAVHYRLKYNHLLRETTLPYEDTTGDSTGSLDYEFSYQEMKNAFIQTALDYRYDIIEEFTEEEIEEALEDFNDRVGVYIGTQEEKEDYEIDQIIYYDNILSSKYGYGISFGSLYEILVREGFDVEGDLWHYTFIGADNIEYEISYDFDDYDHDGDLGYYYMKDGEITPMGAYFYNHFFVFKVEEMTGLQLVDDYYVVGE